jgi:hypothetical protein
LNIYSGQTAFLGFARFPMDCPQNGNISDPMLDDGIIISYKTVPEGGETDFEEGDTLVHEVGHWLGLYHTFQGACRGRDYVADTPSQARPTSSCPVGQDTCGNEGNEGFDPIHNYMDYSDDCCMYQFTEGQVERMRIETSLFRGLGPNLTFMEDTYDCDYPDDGFNYTQCKVSNICFIGDGYCDDDEFSGLFNTLECNFDGCDCNKSLCPEDVCQFPVDGFDYSMCQTNKPCLVGNGMCDSVYDKEECNYDGRDCQSLIVVILNTLDSIQDVGDFFMDLGNGFLDTVSSVGDSIQDVGDFFTDLGNGFLDTVSSVGDSIQDVEDFFTDLWNGFIDSILSIFD